MRSATQDTISTKAILVPEQEILRKWCGKKVRFLEWDKLRVRKTTCSARTSSPDTNRRETLWGSLKKMCRRVALTLLPIAPQLTNEGTDLLLFNVNSGCSEPARFPQSTHSEENFIIPASETNGSLRRENIY